MPYDYAYVVVTPSESHLRRPVAVDGAYVAPTCFDVKCKIFLLLPVLVYYAILMTVLSPWLGDMKLPVRVYGVVICFMLMLALHMPYIQDKKAGLLMMSGALLFVLSDSVLAMNKFYKPFKEADIIIMITYGIAQLSIVQGAIKYIVIKGKKSRQP